MLKSQRTVKKNLLKKEVRPITELTPLPGQQSTTKLIISKKA